MSAKTLLITGCSTGIGYYCAHQMHQRGYRVFATARSEEDVVRLREEGLEALQLDLDDPLSIQKCVDEVMRRCDGKLYGLFNNGAYGQPGAVEDLSREALKAQFETNLFGTHELTTNVLRYMRETGEGRIVQNSSILGFAAMKYRGAYNASKFALEGLSDTLRLELQGSRIFVSLIEPGPIRSAFRKNALAKFLENIDQANSVHHKTYKDKLKQLESEGDAPFTLGPEAVCDALIHALEAKRPKERYYVTFPTTLLGLLKRLLPTRALDFIAAKVD